MPVQQITRNAAEFGTKQSQMKVNTSVAFVASTVQATNSDTRSTLRGRKSARLFFPKTYLRTKWLPYIQSYFLTNQRTEISFSFCRYKRDFRVAGYVMHDGKISINFGPADPKGVEKGKFKPRRRPQGQNVSDRTDNYSRHLLLF